MAAKGASSAIRSPTSRASDRPNQGGRLQSEWVADFRRNRWPDCVGITGRFASDYAAGVPFTSVSKRTCSGDTDQLDRAGQTIPQLLNNAAGGAEENSRHAIDMVQKLSH